MKKIGLLLVLLCALAPALFAQQQLPNISYNGLLTTTCATTNGSCAGAVFVTGSLGPNQNGSLGSGSALDIPVNNYSAATITVSGTYSGSTINFEFSDPTAGTNYFQEVCARTDINLLEVSEVLPTNQVRAWQCPVWAATRFRVRQSAVGSGAVNVWVTLTYAAIDPSLVVAASITNIAGASDPCSDVSAIKSSAVINVASATTTQLVALSGTTTVYVCGYSFTAATGTAATYTFEYGTGASCGTGTTVLTGAMIGNNGPLTYGPASTIFKSASGNAVCLLTGGTSPGAQGVITYVQQ